jgi:hypothetical protein
MKRLTTFILVLSSVTFWGQKNNQATNDFIVTEQIKKKLKFNLTDIEKYPLKTIWGRGSHQSFR